MKLLSLLSCDDIRREVSGKITLVGVFDGLTINDKPPAEVRIAVHLRVRLDDGEEPPDDCAILVTLDGKHVASGTSPIEMKNLGFPFALLAPPLHLTLERTGEVLWEFTFRRNGTAVGETIRFPIPIKFSSSA